MSLGFGDLMDIKTSVLAGRATVKSLIRVESIDPW